MEKHLASLSLSIDDLSVLKCYFPDLVVFIHGSSTQGKKEFGDIDLVVVTSAFSEIVGIKRIQIVCRLLEKTEHKIDPICLTPTEFQRFLVANNIFAFTIRRNLHQMC